MDAAGYQRWITSPFVDEELAGDAGISLVIVDADGADLPPPGSLPVVVAALGSGFGSEGPEHADVVIGPDDVDHLVAAVDTCPLAAVSLVVLLRALSTVEVEHGLALESSVYSMLQAGPEFARWRAATDPRPTDDADTATVRTERTGDRLTVVLDRPHRHNAISRRLRDDLAAALAIALADPSIEAVDLRGAGPSFCSGGDLAEFGLRPDAATAHATRLARSPARLLHRLSERLTAHVHGHTLGGGLEMAAFADRVVAAPDSVLGLPEIGLGLVPGAGGTVSLTRRIGRQRTAALGLTMRHLDAGTALDWHLVDEVVAADT